MWPALGAAASSAHFLKTRRKLSLKTDCPKLSASSERPPDRVMQERSSSRPIWSPLQPKKSTLWPEPATRSATPR